MSFQQGLSGLNAAAKNLDVIGNNVANSGTVGYKESGARFADMFANAGGSSGGVAIGIGTQLSEVQQQFTQGNISITGNPLDLAINGGGFFRLSHNGLISYARDGQFSLDRNGYVVNATGNRLTGYLAFANGTLNTSTPGDLQISSADIPPRLTSALTASVNLNATSGVLPTAGFIQANASTYHSATSASVFDSLGNQHALSMYFLKTAANTWDVYGALDGTPIGYTLPGTAVPLGTMEFDGSTGALKPSGSSLTTFPSTVSAAVSTGATTPMTFNLDFTGTTQYGSAFGVNALDQDGFAPGRLAGSNVSGDGTILGRYTNGQSKVLGQVVMATFNNPNGLQSGGGNAWSESLDSGQPLVGIPGTGRLGTIQAGAVEDSNVDVTAELVNMITAQRVYQANAQTIKTQDSVLQTLVNMR
jgi:flagellar hook protein FlgE